MPSLQAVKEFRTILDSSESIAVEKAARNPVPSQEAAHGIPDCLACRARARGLRFRMRSGLNPRIASKQILVFCRRARMSRAGRAGLCSSHSVVATFAWWPTANKPNPQADRAAQSVSPRGGWPTLPLSRMAVVGEVIRCMSSRRHIWSFIDVSTPCRRPCHLRRPSDSNPPILEFDPRPAAVELWLGCSPIRTVHRGRDEPVDERRQ